MIKAVGATFILSYFASCNEILNEKCIITRSEVHNVLLFCFLNGVVLIFIFILLVNVQSNDLYSQHRKKKKKKRQDYKISFPKFTQHRYGKVKEILTYSLRHRQLVLVDHSRGRSQVPYWQCLRHTISSPLTVYLMASF